MTSEAALSWQILDELQHEQKQLVRAQAQEQRAAALERFRQANGVFGVVSTDSYNPCDLSCKDGGVVDQANGWFLCKRHGKVHDCPHSTKHPHVLVSDDGMLVCSLTGLVISSQILDDRVVSKRADHGDGGGKRTRGVQHFKRGTTYEDGDDDARPTGRAKRPTHEHHDTEGDEGTNGRGGGVGADDGAGADALIDTTELCGDDEIRDDGEEEDDDVVVDEADAALAQQLEEELLAEGRVFDPSQAAASSSSPPRLEQLSAAAPPQHVQNLLSNLSRKSGSGVGSNNNFALSKKRSPSGDQRKASGRKGAAATSTNAPSANHLLVFDTPEYLEAMGEMQGTITQMFNTLFSESRQREASADVLKQRRQRFTSELRNYQRSCTKQGNKPSLDFIKELQQRIMNGPTTSSAAATAAASSDSAASTNLLNSPTEKRLAGIIARSWATLRHFIGSKGGQTTLVHTRNLRPQFVLGMLFLLREGLTVDSLDIFKRDAELQQLPPFMTLLNRAHLKHHLLTNGRNCIMAAIVRARNNGESVAEMLASIYPQKRMYGGISVSLAMLDLPSPSLASGGV